MANELVEYVRESRKFFFPYWYESAWYADGGVRVVGYSPGEELLAASGGQNIHGPIADALMKEYERRKLAGRAKYSKRDKRTMDEADELKLGKAIHDVLRRNGYRLGSCTHGSIVSAALSVIRGLYQDGAAVDVKEKNEALRQEINARFIFAMQEVNEVLDTIECGAHENPVKAVRTLKEKVGTW